MNIEEKAAAASRNEKLKNDFITEYRNFILSSASRVLKRSVTDSDDEFMVAMIAFNEAIDCYDNTKGNFLSFAYTIIRNRLIDELRRNSRNLSAFFFEPESNGKTPFDIPYYDKYDIKWEIEALNGELSDFGISFFELAKFSPKSRKTKQLCFDAVRYIVNSTTLLETVMKQHILPIKEISEGVPLNRKSLEISDKETLSIAKNIGVSIAKAKAIEEYTEKNGGDIFSNAKKFNDTSVKQIRSIMAENTHKTADIPVTESKDITKPSQTRNTPHITEKKHDNTAPTSKSIAPKERKEDKPITKSAKNLTKKTYEVINKPVFDSVTVNDTNLQTKAHDNITYVYKLKPTNAPNSSKNTSTTIMPTNQPLEKGGSNAEENKKPTTDIDNKPIFPTPSPTEQPHKYILQFDTPDYNEDNTNIQNKDTLHNSNSVTVTPQPENSKPQNNTAPEQNNDKPQNNNAPKKNNDKPKENQPPSNDSIQQKPEQNNKLPEQKTINGADTKKKPNNDRPMTGSDAPGNGFGGSDTNKTIH